METPEPREKSLEEATKSLHFKENLMQPVHMQSKKQCSSYQCRQKEH